MNKKILHIPHIAPFIKMIFENEYTVMNEGKEKKEKNFSRTSYVYLYIHLSIYVFNIFTAQTLIFRQ